MHLAYKSSSRLYLFIYIQPPTFPSNNNTRMKNKFTYRFEMCVIFFIFYFIFSFLSWCLSTSLLRCTSSILWVYIIYIYVTHYRAYIVGYMLLLYYFAFHFVSLKKFKHMQHVRRHIYNMLIYVWCSAYRA